MRKYVISRNIKFEIVKKEDSDPRTLKSAFARWAGALCAVSTRAEEIKTESVRYTELHWTSLLNDEACRECGTHDTESYVAMKISWNNRITWWYVCMHSVHDSRTIRTKLPCIHVTLRCSSNSIDRLLDCSHSVTHTQMIKQDILYDLTWNARIHLVQFTKSLCIWNIITPDNGFSNRKKIRLFSSVSRCWRLCSVYKLWELRLSLTPSTFRLKKQSKKKMGRSAFNMTFSFEFFSTLWNAGRFSPKILRISA